MVNYSICFLFVSGLCIMRLAANSAMQKMHLFQLATPVRTTIYSLDQSSQSTCLYINRSFITKHQPVCQQTNHHKTLVCMSTDQSPQNTCLYVNRPITSKHWSACQSALHWMCEHVKVEINQRHYFSQSDGRKFQYKSSS